MDVGGSSLPDTINPSSFPAKLWRLVNNPEHEAICWDNDGTGIVIDRHLLTHVLYAGGVAAGGAAFRSTHFPSFIRRLHLYGFKSIATANNSEDHYLRGSHCHFFNPNFKRNHPELLVTLRRQAAFMGTKKFNDGHVTTTATETLSPLSPPRLDSTPPLCTTNRQHSTPYNGTPVPPRRIRRRCGAPLSPSVFVSDNRVPAALCHNYSGTCLSSNARHSRRAFPAHAHRGKPNVLICAPPNVQHQPGHCSTDLKHHQPNVMASHLTATGPQAVQCSPDIYYQASYSVDEEYQEVKKCPVNLEAFSQIGDVATPPPMPANSRVANRPQPAMVAVSNAADVIRHRQEEEFMLPAVSEQMPDDAIL